MARALLVDQLVDARKERGFAFLFCNAAQGVKACHPARVHSELRRDRRMADHRTVTGAKRFGSFAPPLAAGLGAVLPVLRPGVSLLLALVAALLAFLPAFFALVAAVSAGG